MSAFVVGRLITADSRRDGRAFRSAGILSDRCPFDSRTLKARADARPSGKDPEAAGRLKGGCTIRSRIDGTAGQPAALTTSCRRGSEALHRVRPLICRRRRWHRVPYRAAGKARSTGCLAHSPPCAADHAARRSRCRLSEASGEETEEARTSLNRVSPCQSPRDPVNHIRHSGREPQ
jgi:hypothetical protein